MKNKVTSLILALAMCMVLCVPTLALTDKEASAITQIQLIPDSFNEYDYIVELRRMDNNQLKSRGISSQEIAYIESNEIESEFQYRATLSEDVLKDHYCYSNEAIAVLKKYDGGRLETRPEMRVVAATLSAGMQTLVSGSTRMGVLYSWSWNQSPGSLYSDLFALAWEGTYANGGNNNAKLDTQNSFANVNYYFSTSTPIKQESLSLTSKSLYHNVETTSFATNKFINNQLHWAKSGNMFVYMDLANTNGPKFVELAAHAEYGHYTGSVQVGVSFPWGLSISFSGSVVPCGSQNISVRA